MEKDDASSNSSSGNSSIRPSLDLRHLSSAERIRKSQLEKGTFKGMTLVRVEDEKIWNQVKAFSMLLLDKLVENSGKVPKEIETLANDKYGAASNVG